MRQDAVSKEALRGSRKACCRTNGRARLPGIGAPAGTEIDDVTRDPDALREALLLGARKWGSVVVTGDSFIFRPHAYSAAPPMPRLRHMSAVFIAPSLLARDRDDLLLAEPRLPASPAA